MSQLKARHVKHNSLLVTFQLNASFALISKLHRKCKFFFAKVITCTLKYVSANQCKIDGIHYCLSPRANDYCHFAHVSASAKIYTENHSFSCKNLDVHLPQTENSKERNTCKFQKICVQLFSSKTRLINERRLGKRSIKVNCKEANKNTEKYHMTVNP